MAEETQAVEELENDDFDAAFEERAQLVPNYDPEEGSGSEEDQGQTGDNGAAGEPDQDGAFEGSFDNAVKPGDDQETAEEEETEPTQDELAAKLEEQSKEIERLKQSERSQRGRVSALTKKLAKQRAESMETPQPAEVKEVAEGEEPDTQDDDAWEEFKADFPEMAEIVESRISKVENNISQVQSDVNQVRETTDTLTDKEIIAYKEQQYNILEERHPDFLEARNSSEFQLWFANTSEENQEKVKSLDAEDAIALLDAFKTETEWGQAADVQEKSDVQKLKEQRQAALKNSAGVSSKKVGRAPKSDTESDDFDSAFGAAARKKEKQRVRTY